MLSSGLFVHAGPDGGSSRSSDNGAMSTKRQDERDGEEEVCGVAHCRGVKRKIKEEKSKDRRDERNGARTSNHKTRNRKGQKNTHVHFSTKYGLFVSKHESIFAQRMAYSYMHYVCGERLEDVKDCKGVKMPRERWQNT